jgi:hypothetical protein
LAILATLREAQAQHILNLARPLKKLQRG